MDEAADPFPAVVVSTARDQADLDRLFERAMRETANLAVRVAYGVLRHREDAEEVAQEAFARAYRRFHTLRDPERFRAWIVRVTWRAAIDRWRSDRRRTAREQATAAEQAAPSAEEDALRAERSALLWKAIDALPDKLRLVVILGSMQGHDVRAVARLLRIPEGTVKSRLFLARAELAERLSCLATDIEKR